MVEADRGGPKHVAPRQGSVPEASVWRGHEPTTCAALLILLERAATGGDTDFSHDERVFCTACEFWSAVATRSLDAYLRQEAIAYLAAAQVAFVRIGAMQVPTVLQQALSRHSRNELLPAARRHLAQELTQNLLSTTDPVNQLIANFASRLPTKSPL